MRAKHGTGENDGLRRELVVVLMNRYDAVCSDEGRYEMMQGVIEGLEGLATGRDLSEVVGTLEISGTISHLEALRFSRARYRQRHLEEAVASSSSPALALVKLNAGVFSGFKSWREVMQLNITRN